MYVHSTVQHCMVDFPQRLVVPLRKTANGSLQSLLVITCRSLAFAVTLSRESAQVAELDALSPRAPDNIWRGACGFMLDL